MHYISTRGEAPAQSFCQVLLQGLAPDGGLYVPETWPTLEAQDICDLQGAAYPEVAVRVMAPFVKGEIADQTFADLVQRAYESFQHPAVAPLVQLTEQHWLLELFHGPTLAFKDVAMQLLGHLFDHVLGERGERLTIVGATSGDTGSAAIEAMRGRDAVDIFILHPQGRTSEIQRRQMTTVDDENVHNIAIKGTFDDCQALVKEMFADRPFREEIRMGGVNSINWARVMAQTVYYFTSAVALGGPDRQVAFSVPTGNFGDILAGYVAKRMGLPIAGLGIATNVNDILCRALATGRYAVSQVQATSSPSMDIQVSSNFERLLFEACGRQPGTIRAVMNNLRQSQAFTIEQQALETIARDFSATRIDEAETAAIIRRTYETCGMLIDPHTAVGVGAAHEMKLDRAVPIVSLATASPAKFPDVVKSATGIEPPLPVRLADVFTRNERYTVLDNRLDEVEAFIRARRRK